MFTARRMRFSGLGLATALCGAGPTFGLELKLPIACEVGQTCFIQNYVDHDASPGARDYMCAGETYEAHNGTDFRLPSMARQHAGVAVLAAADGRVLRTRDGMTDVSVRAIGIDQVKGRECGNGVIVQHADGFESEYCHLARGSVRVKPDEAVVAGEPIGNVGLSGKTEFPHLHFTLRQDGKVVDPFAYGAADGTCGGGTSLWDKKLAAELAYRPIAVLNAGFAARPVSVEDIETGAAETATPGPDAEDLIAYVRAIGLRAGDVQRLTIIDPNGKPFAAYAVEPLGRDVAQYTLTTGRKRPPDGWVHGVYHATYTVEHNGEHRIEKTFELRL